MRKSNKILKLTNLLGFKFAFLFLLIMSAAQGAFAYSFSAVAPSGQTLYYNIVGGNAEVTYPTYHYYSITKPTGSLTIPSSVTYGGNTYSVTAINSHAFFGCTGLTSVNIPNSVVYIMDYAFYGCSGLTSVTIGNSVAYIWDYAFYGCSGLTSVTFPNSVHSIGDSAFYGCSGLTSVTIGNSVISIGNSAFKYCTGLTTVFFNADSCSTAGSIYDVAFGGDTNVSTIIFGNNVTRIPSYLCSGLRGLSSVNIPNSVTTIGNSAFGNCSGLTSVNIPNSVTTIGNNAFWNCSGLTSVNIPNSVTSIGNYAFYYCSGLNSVTIGNSVTSIENNAFYNCSGLTSVTIPNSVTSIGNKAFYNCSGLTSVTIGTSVTHIGQSAFGNCTGLSTVNFNADSCIYAGSSSYVAFSGDTNISTINFGNNVTRIPEYLCYGLIGLSSVTIPNSVTAIGDRAFSYCSGLNTVTIGNSVTSIGNSAFNYCTGLTTVNFNATRCIYAGGSGYAAFGGDTNISTINFGNNVTRIPEYLCYGLRGLSSVTIPDSVTDIGSHSFSDCRGLTSVTIGNSVIFIRNNAFSDCSGLTSVTIPNSVTDISYEAFYNCSGLTSVTIGNSVTYIGESAFRNCTGLTTVSFNADSCIHTGSSSHVVFEGDTRISTMNFGNNVTIIPMFLCKNLGGLTSVTIPNSVTTIENWAFNGCTGLDTVWLLPNVPPSISSGSFPSSVDCFFVRCDTYNAYYNDWGWRGYRTLLQIYNWPNFVVNVSVNNSTYGTATIIQQSNHDVSCDSLCIISATSNYGYHFDHWNNGRTSNPDTLHIMGDSIIMAYFSPNQYGVVGIPYYSDRGHVFGSDTVDYLDTVVLTAVANHGYMFDHWSDGAYENPHSVVANGDRTIMAYFTPVQLSLSVASADEDMGTVSGGGNYDYQSYITIRAIANTGYHFTHWNDGDNSSSRTLILTQDTSFTAYFAPNQYTLTLQSADETLGIVNGGGEYNYHDTVTISATAIAPHYHFESWSDNNTDNPRQIIVSGDIALTAYFSINVYDVVLEVDSLIHGTVSGDGSYTYGTAATVTATPYSGWQFWHWSDGATYNPYTFAVVQDTVLTAYFVREGSQNDIDSISTPNIKIHAEGQQIVVEGAEGNTVMVYDLYGRVLAIKRDEGTLLRFDVPATGTYLIRIGDSPARRVVVVR